MTGDKLSGTGDDLSRTSITIQRTFDAPIDRLWAAWYDPDELASWSAPAGWQYEILEHEFRTGGVHRYCMHGPDNEESWGRTVYEEIVDHERIVHLDTFTDEDGTAVGEEFEIVVEFVERGSQTDLTLSHAGLPEGADEEAIAGWESGLDELAAHLEESA